MKTLLVGFAGCLMVISCLALTGCACTGTCGRVAGCAPCSPYTTVCQCTDPNAGRNPCMSIDKYCEAFGNVGAR